jgi:23S rRNA pseudouridine1911/1915/1917 synthase
LASSIHGFEILHEDTSCLVINKPTGVLTQAPPGIDCVEWRIKRYLQFSTNSVKEPYLGVPHRLDRPVSGAMVFAKTKPAARHLHEQFQQKKVGKRYWALLAGSVSPASGEWIDWMRKIDGESRSELVAEDHPEAKQAILRYQMMSCSEQWSWVEIELLTGRSHQIRLQSSSRGHSVLGDFQYGSVLPFGPAVEDSREQPLALHSRSLGFHHPESGKAMLFEAPLPVLWDQHTNPKR